MNLGMSQHQIRSRRIYRLLHQLMLSCCTVHADLTVSPRLECRQLSIDSEYVIQNHTTLEIVFRQTKVK
jgi:hypothetical protein